MPTSHVTCSAVALYCCKAHAKISRKMRIRPPCIIVTPENFILKLSTHNYVREITLHANFGFNRHNGGFSPNRRNITTSWVFWLSCPYLFLDPAPRSNALWLKWRVSLQGWSFYGLGRWTTSYASNLPPPPKKWVWSSIKPKQLIIKIAISC